MPTLDLALGLRVVLRITGMLHSFALQPFRSIEPLLIAMRNASRRNSSPFYFPFISNIALWRLELKRDKINQGISLFDAPAFDA
ncbi:MAG: hypothetical protein ACI94O_001905 [Octadecabacter sp.]|jgi:hypothetical protein